MKVHHADYTNVEHGHARYEFVFAKVVTNIYSEHGFLYNITAKHMFCEMG